MLSLHTVCCDDLLVGSQRCVVGEGMPTYKLPFEKGNLYVKFEVTFPPDGFISEREAKVFIDQWPFVLVLY